MSYVQGTAVKLQADFWDPDLEEPVDPGEVILTVRDPAGAVLEYSLSAGEVLDDPEAFGRFYYRFDTSPMAGTWQYQFESTGVMAALGRKELTVRSRI